MAADLATRLFRRSRPTPPADPLTGMTAVLETTRAAVVAGKISDLLGGPSRGTLATAGAAVGQGQPVQVRADGTVEPAVPGSLVYGTALAAAQPGQGVVVAFPGVLTDEYVAALRAAAGTVSTR